MATLPSFLLSSSSSLPLIPPPRPSLRRSVSSLSFCPLRPTRPPPSRKFPALLRASSVPSFDDLTSDSRSSPIRSSKKSILSNLIHEIEPLDVSLIQKDVPPATVDAMKRTISGMLGLLPSVQFQVFIEALWEPLSKLLVSSMMTGCGLLKFGIYGNGRYRKRDVDCNWSRSFWKPTSKTEVGVGGRNGALGSERMEEKYTLRNADYRLCLEKNLDVFEENLEKQRLESSESDEQGMLLESANVIKSSSKDQLSSKTEKIHVEPSENIEGQGIEDMSPEAQEYVRHLQSQLSSVEKELHEVKRRSAALQMQQFVGEEKNDLLDYLRSLQPEKWENSPLVTASISCNVPQLNRLLSSNASYTIIIRFLEFNSLDLTAKWRKTRATVKLTDLLIFLPLRLQQLLPVFMRLADSFTSFVAELSEPTCPELKETIHSIVHGLLATLSPRIHSKAPLLSQNTPIGTAGAESGDCAEIIENTSLQFQPLISLTRDYLARLLFWCMLLGHYLRGLEYRMELMELLSLTSDAGIDAHDDKQAA
ncbi:hypothetical protein TIFTF001_007105 [Ficus carica]|uniref:Uncharacterized protein n=1 Tax=Ficus carica TaxID=3494 RepID=A0AA87ZPQ7_FICCA|nr:hypothetical protein TIFTF001_007105 [Ficus carica]